jgi:hypothetical protein
MTSVESRLQRLSGSSASIGGLFFATDHCTMLDDGSDFQNRGNTVVAEDAPKSNYYNNITNSFLQKSMMGLVVSKYWVN